MEFVEGDMSRREGPSGQNMSDEVVVACGEHL